MADPYSRLDYRRLIAWPRRIEREWPLLSRVLGEPEGRAVLDLGCGTGEHARFLASRGFEVTGIDTSESMLREANREPLPGNLRFVHADLEELDRTVEGSFDGAICLGNTLPHLRTVEGLRRFLRGLRQRLRPAAPILLQLLNYERIFRLGLRHLPVNVRPHQDGDGEIVFLRLIETHEDGGVSFFPSTLVLDPERDPPLELRSSKRVELHGWRRSELEPELRGAGFAEIRSHGDFAGGRFDPLEAMDLILVAR